MAKASGTNNRTKRSPINLGMLRLRNENLTPTPDIKKSMGKRHWCTHRMIRVIQGEVSSLLISQV